MTANERRRKLLDLLAEHDANDPDALARKIEALYGKADPPPARGAVWGCPNCTCPACGEARHDQRAADEEEQG